MLVDILNDTIKDTYIMLPLLFILYLCLEYFEHKEVTQKYENALTTYGPILGAILGIIPQCGFGVIASLLFIERKITLGTLISVFIATSDEALPILLAHPEHYSSLLLMIVLKCVLAIIIGYCVDFIFKKSLDLSHSDDQEPHEHAHSDFLEALIRTCKVYFFIFIVNFGLSYIIEMIGDETLATLLLDKSMIQPIVSGIFGFIPNCVASVVLTQLYMNEMVSFASLLAGLMTNAGLGILMLIQKKVPTRTIMSICGILFISAMIVCLPLQWFLLH